MGMVGLTLFLRTEMQHNTINDGALYMDALFFNMMTIMFNGTTELPSTIFKLPVFVKQRDMLFYPAWVYALPTWILKIPLAFVETALWASLTYYPIGLDPSIQR